MIILLFSIIDIRDRKKFFEISENFCSPHSSDSYAKNEIENRPGTLNFELAKNRPYIVPWGIFFASSKFKVPGRFSKIFLLLIRKSLKNVGSSEISKKIFTTPYRFN